MIKITIGKKTVGNGNPCFIIADAGSNHNGSIRIAKRLIDVASTAGADAVKFQLFRADKLYVKNSGYANYLKIKKPIYKIIKETEMPYEWLPVLRDYCKKRDIIFLVSVFDEESSDVVEKFVPAYKIGSCELTHIPLIEHVAKKKKPIILSTAMGSNSEISEAVSAIHRNGNNEIVLMHCVASYPAPMNVTNLNLINKLKKRFDVPVGMSDHSEDPIIIPVAAVSAGANMIEKHLTLNKKMKGPDHRFAIEPNELEKMVRAVRATESAFRNSGQELKEVESELRHFARRGVFSTKNIVKGELFTKENIAVLRSGSKVKGVEPKEFLKILGKKAKLDIKAGEAIKKGDY